MKTNKRVRTPKAKAAKAALQDKPSSSSPKKGQPTTRELRERVHRLEVEIIEAPRLAKEKYLRNLHMVPPPYIARSKSIKPRLTFAQAKARRAKKMLLHGEFLFSCALIAGVLTWVIKWWKTMP